MGGGEIVMWKKIKKRKEKKKKEKEEEKARIEKTLKEMKIAWTNQINQ